MSHAFAGMAIPGSEGFAAEIASSPTPPRNDRERTGHWERSEAIWVTPLAVKSTRC